MVLSLVGAAQSYIYRIGASIVILLFGFGFGILAKKLVKRILTEIELNRIMAKVGVMYNLEKWLSSLVSYLIYLVTIVLSLNQLGITSVVLYLLVGGVLMLVILTFLVGLKDVIPNFVAWILLQRKERIKEGHAVEVREIAGRVERVGYLETEIRTPSGDILYVPNSLFLKSKFKIKR